MVNCLSRCVVILCFIKKILDASTYVIAFIFKALAASHIKSVLYE